MAMGKYICFLDADDWIEPPYLEKTLAILETDESIGACYSWVHCFGDRNDVVMTEDLDPFSLRLGTTAPSQSVIRKQAWRTVSEANGSGFLTKYNGYFEDWVFWIDMVQCGYRGIVIKEALINYRVHKDSLSATYKPGFDNMLKVLHEDRKRFFQDRRYMRELHRRLNRSIRVENSLVNLSAREIPANSQGLDYSSESVAQHEESAAS
jgi:glycosyltransferase involved in cell wall biosynthesis